MQKHAAEIFGKKVFDHQADAMAEGTLRFPQGKKCHKCAERYLDINDELLYLGTDAKKFSGKKINKQLLKAMPDEAALVYANQGGLNLSTRAKILDVIEEVDDILDFQAKINQCRN